MRNIAIIWALLLLSPLISFADLKQDSPEDQNVSQPAVGWVEKVRVLPPDILMHAKLDTGADYSSLHAEGIKGFQKQGDDWVRFTVRNRYGVRKKLEYPVVRIARIKRHSGKTQQRYVINLGICLGSFRFKAEVNLVNRRHFDYQMLVGRSFLARNFLVDPSRTYTINPKCSLEEEV